MTDAKRDKYLHVHTEGTLEILQNSSHYNRYEATPYAVLDELFTAYPLRSDDHLVDYGCGKGRVPIYCNHRFQCDITGIDLNGRLLQEAYANLGSYRSAFGKKNGAVTFEQEKAELYTILPAQNVFYFFNPFSVGVFQSVIHRIARSLEEAPRTATILLYYPTGDYLRFLDDQTAFERVEERAVPLLSDDNPDERFLVYRWE